MTRHFSHIFFTDGLTFIPFWATLQAYNYTNFGRFCQNSQILDLDDDFEAKFVPGLSVFESIGNSTFC